MPSQDLQTDLVYDVGLHKGEDAEFYLKKGFRVVAIEAVRHLVQTSSERLRAYLESGQLIVLNLAIADKHGPVTFFENANSVWGTAYPDWAHRNELLGSPSVKTTVQGVPFADILRRYGVPYYLKIDIEGADLLCLQALLDLSVRPKYVSIESTKTSWKGLLQEFAILKKVGYSKFQIIPQHMVSRQSCPVPAKEGEDVAHQFEFGSSGLFGQELPGNWLSDTEALRQYRSIFLGYKVFGDRGIVHRLPLVKRVLSRAHLLPEVGWYDTHATT